MQHELYVDRQNTDPSNECATWQLKSNFSLIQSALALSETRWREMKSQEWRVLESGG